MWKIMRINTKTNDISIEDYKEEYRELGGRSLIDQVLTEEVAPTCDPLSADNKLLMATGLFAGTNIPTAHRLSVGGKSPLTGGIKESNVGGTGAYYLAGHGIKLLIFEDIPSDEKWQMLYIDQNGDAKLLPADNYVGLSTYSVVEKAQKNYNKNISVITIGPAGEMGYLYASIGITEYQSDYPCRAAGRGGMGTLMGSKKIKLIVIEKPESRYVPQIADPERMKEATKAVTKYIIDIADYVPASTIGTISSLAMTGPIGIMPYKNFSGGVNPDYSKIGPEQFMENLESRGGSNRHICQPNCPFHCSNIYNDKDGKFLTAALEYETVALNGSNLCISDLDTIARIDRFCDEFGIDTMELGGTLGVCMEMGVVLWGDSEGVFKLLDDLKNNTDFGKILGQGTKRCGEHLGCKRIPTVKNQSIPSFDPRNLKGTGLTYAISPQGADHTTGITMGTGFDGVNAGTKKLGQLFISRFMQLSCVLADSCMCMTPFLLVSAQMPLLIDIFSAMFGKEFTSDIILGMAVNTILTERAFNEKAGFTVQDDRLPGFFYEEPAKATGAVFDFNDDEVQWVYNFV